VLWIFIWLFTHVIWDFFTRWRLEILYPLSESVGYIDKKKWITYINFVLIFFPIYILWKICNVVNKFRNTFFMLTWSFLEKNILSAIFVTFNFILYFYLIKYWYFNELKVEITTLVWNNYVVLWLIFISLIMSFYIFSIWIKKISKIWYLIKSIIKLLAINISVIILITILFYFLWLFSDFAFQLLYFVLVFFSFFVTYNLVMSDKFSFSYFIDLMLQLYIIIFYWTIIFYIYWGYLSNIFSSFNILM